MGDTARIGWVAIALVLVELLTDRLALRGKTLPQDVVPKLSAIPGHNRLLPDSGQSLIAGRHSQESQTSLANWLKSRSG